MCLAAMVESFLTFHECNMHGFVSYLNNGEITFEFN